MRALISAIALLVAGQAHAVGTIWELSGTVGEVAGPDAGSLAGDGVVVGAPFTARFRFNPTTPFTPPDAWVGAITWASFDSGSFSGFVIPVAGGTVTHFPGGDSLLMEIGPSFGPTLGVPGFRFELTGFEPTGSFPPYSHVLFELFTNSGAASVRSTSLSVKTYLPEPDIGSLLLAVGAALTFARGWRRPGLRRPFRALPSR